MPVGDAHEDEPGQESVGEQGDEAALVGHESNDVRCRCGEKEQTANEPTPENPLAKAGNDRAVDGCPCAVRRSNEQEILLRARIGVHRRCQSRHVPHGCVDVESVRDGHSLGVLLKPAH